MRGIIVNLNLQGIIKMTVEKTNQFILISDIVNNQYIKQKYIGYSIKDCKKMFKQYINEYKTGAF